MQVDSSFSLGVKMVEGVVNERKKLRGGIKVSGSAPTGIKD